METGKAEIRDVIEVGGCCSRSGLLLDQGGGGASIACPLDCGRGIQRLILGLASGVGNTFVRRFLRLVDFLGVGLHLC